MTRYQLKPRETQSPLDGDSRAAMQARRAAAEEKPKDRLAHGPRMRFDQLRISRRPSWLARLMRLGRR